MEREVDAVHRAGLREPCKELPDNPLEVLAHERPSRDRQRREERDGRDAACEPRRLDEPRELGVGQVARDLRRHHPRRARERLAREVVKPLEVGACRHERRERVGLVEDPTVRDAQRAAAAAESREAAGLHEKSSPMNRTSSCSRVAGGAASRSR